MMQIFFGTRQFGYISAFLNSIDQQNFLKSQTLDETEPGTCLFLGVFNGQADRKGWPLPPLTVS